MLKECAHILQLSAKGENQEKAFYQIFAQIRTTTAKAFPDRSNPIYDGGGSRK